MRTRSQLGLRHPHKTPAGPSGLGVDFWGWSCPGFAFHSKHGRQKQPDVGLGDPGGPLSCRLQPSGAQAPQTMSVHAQPAACRPWASAPSDKAPLWELAGKGLTSGLLSYPAQAALPKYLGLGGCSRLEAGSLRPGCQRGLGSDEASPPGLLCPHLAEKGSEPWCLFLFF